MDHCYRRFGSIPEPRSRFHKPPKRWSGAATGHSHRPDLGKPLWERLWVVGVVGGIQHDPRAAKSRSQLRAMLFVRGRCFQYRCSFARLEKVVFAANEKNQLELYTRKPDRPPTGSQESGQQREGVVLIEPGNDLSGRHEGQPWLAVLLMRQEPGVAIVTPNLKQYRSALARIQHFSGNRRNAQWQSGSN